jgi:hypothetical protein
MFSASRASSSAGRSQRGELNYVAGSGLGLSLSGGHSGQRVRSHAAPPPTVRWVAWRYFAGSVPLVSLAPPMDRRRVTLNSEPAIASRLSAILCRDSISKCWFAARPAIIGSRLPLTVANVANAETDPAVSRAGPPLIPTARIRCRFACASWAYSLSFSARRAASRWRTASVGRHVVEHRLGCAGPA